jgi:Mimiviridae putative ATP-dependent RNA helicase
MMSCYFSEYDVGVMSAQEALLQLTDYQENVRDHVRFGRNLLAFWSPGSGKTIGALTICSAALDSCPADTRVLIACPKSTKMQWEEEYKKFFRTKIKHIVYETHDEVILPKERNYPYILVLDEAHRFRASSQKFSVRQMNMVTVACNAERVYLLTGTPVWNKPAEFATLYAMLLQTDDDGEMKTFFRAFQQAGRTGQEGVSNFAKWLKCLVSYFKKKRTDKEYPTVEPPEFVTYPMTKTEEEDYLKVSLQKYRVGPKGKPINQHAFLTGYRHATNVQSKLDWVYDRVLWNAVKSRKTIVYSNFLEPLAKLKVQIEKKGKGNIGVLLITGKSSEGQIAQVKATYNERKNKYQVLLISSAGSEGLDLHETRNVIILEPHWNIARTEQVIGRAVRKGSHKNLPEHERTVLVTHLNWTIRENPAKLITTDTHLHALHNKKEGEIEVLVNGLCQASIENQYFCRLVNSPVVTWTEPRGDSKGEKVPRKVIGSKKKTKPDSQKGPHGPKSMSQTDHGRKRRQGTSFEDLPGSVRQRQKKPLRHLTAKQAKAAEDEDAEREDQEAAAELAEITVADKEVKELYSKKRRLSGEDMVPDMPPSKRYRPPSPSFDDDLQRTLEAPTDDDDMEMQLERKMSQFYDSRTGRRGGRGPSFPCRKSPLHL